MLLVLQAHAPADGDRPRVEQARGLQLLAAQADHQRLAAEVRVAADVPQGADGDRGAGRVDGHAAAVGVRQGHHAVDVRVARQDLRPDAPHGVLHRRGDTLHGGRDAEQVARADGAVGIAVALEGVAFERRQGRGRGGGQGQLVQSRRGGQLEQSSRTQRPAGMARAGVADHAAVAHDGRRRCQVRQRHLVRLRNGLRSASPPRNTAPAGRPSGLATMATLSRGMHADDHRLGHVTRPACSHTTHTANGCWP